MSHNDPTLCIAEDEAEGTSVGGVASYKGDTTDGEVVQDGAALLVEDFDAVDVDLKLDARLVGSGSLDGRLGRAHRFGAHLVSTRGRYILLSNEFSLNFELLAKKYIDLTL